MSGIVREEGGHALLINGVADHPHMFVRLPVTVALADFMRVVKANSAKWVHRTQRNFGWQTGYAYFSVSHSNSDSVAKYIAGQDAHHNRMSFKDELPELLRRHHVQYDERCIWD